MIYALSLNPCLDKTAAVPCFSLDAPNRIQVERLDLGGKGVNVARVLLEMAGEGLLMGFDYAGEPVKTAMEKEHIPAWLLPVSGDLRVNMKLRDLETGHTIEINERGAEVSEAQLQQLMDELLRRCRPGDWVSLSGSLPPGAKADTYAILCRSLREKGCFVAVDCDGPALMAALERGPSLLKPNAQEFFALTGVQASDLPAALAACRKLHAKGIQMICLSRGEEGAVLSTAEGAWECPAADVPALGVQGAGDSMLAGLLIALSRGYDAPKALRYATAVAGASVMRPGTLLGQKADAERLLQQLPIPRSCF